MIALALADWFPALPEFNSGLGYMTKLQQSFSFDAPDAGPSLTFERRLGTGGAVCGVDEAGRGPWAGPVSVAAVILRADRIPEGLNDSKQLTAAERDRLYDAILADHQVALVQASGYGDRGEVRSFQE